MTSDRRFFAVSALLFLGSAAVTIFWCVSMRMMQSGTMAMAGMGWPAAAFSFLVMWLVMMAAMMLPSLVPMLARYRRAVAAADLRLDRLTALAGAGYFFVWSLFGVAAFALRTALTVLETQVPVLRHAAPLAAIAVLLTAGRLPAQRHESPRPGLLPGSTQAFAGRCGRGLAPRPAVGTGLRDMLRQLTVILLVIGMMDLAAMIAVTAAITAERLLPTGHRIAQAIGAVTLAAGLLLAAQALTA